MSEENVEVVRKAIAYRYDGVGELAGASKSLSRWYVHGDGVAPAGIAG